MDNWRKEDKKYVETNAYNHVLNQIKSNNCVTVTGTPGSGKTALLKHIVLHFSREGYTFFPVVIPEDLRTYFKPGQRRIFVIDDEFGKSSTNITLITAWQQYKTVAMEITKDGNYKIIIACRLQIYLDDLFNRLNFFKTCECDVVSKELKLTYEEQIKIAKSLIPNFKVGKTKLPNVDCFPLLCHICGANPDIDAAHFFLNPFQVLKEELDSFFNEGSDESRFKLGALALLVLHNNELKKCIFKSDNVHMNQIADICSIFKLPSVSPIHKIQNALGTLTETYVIEEQDTYIMKHDMLFQFILNYFTESKDIDMIGCLIEHSSMDMIHDRFTLYKVKGEHIIIPKEYHNAYFKRIIKDWFDEQLWSVLDNRNTKETDYRKNMIQYLKELDRTQQKKLADMNIQTENNESFSPLVWCCYYGYADILKWLASVDVDINRKIYLKGSFFSPLTIACAKNQTEMITTFLNLGAEVNTINKEDISPIYSACTTYNSEHVKLLLNYNANINIKGHYEVTPLLLVCLKNDIKIVKLLLQHNASCDCCFSNHCSSDEESECLQWLNATCPNFVKKYKNLNKGTFLEFLEGASPLHIACFNENDKIVEDILKKNPKINIQKKDGATPLFIACELGNKDIVCLLLDKGADTEIKKKDGATPLSVAKDYVVRKIILDTNERNAFKVV